MVNSPFTAEEEHSGELPFWQQQRFIDQLLDAGRWLIVLLVVWLMWHRGVRPILQRRAEEARLAKGAERERQALAEATEVHLTRDEQNEQRRHHQRLSAEVMSQRIRDMSDNDPRVVALVIRQWISGEL